MEDSKNPLERSPSVFLSKHPDPTSPGPGPGRTAAYACARPPRRSAANSPTGLAPFVAGCAMKKRQTLSFARGRVVISFVFNLDHYLYLNAGGSLGRQRPKKTIQKIRDSSATSIWEFVAGFLYGFFQM